MHTRTFGRTGWQVSEIGFGGWGIGGGHWGGADDAESMRTLHAALDAVERLKALVPPGATLAAVQEIDDAAIRPLVHQRW